MCGKKRRDNFQPQSKAVIFGFIPILQVQLKLDPDLIFFLFCRRKHYGKGIGLSVYVDGKQVVAPSALGKKLVAIEPPPTLLTQPHLIDLAANDLKSGYLWPSASINNTDELYQAVDGRVWYFPGIANYWSTQGSTNAEDWFSIDLGSEKQIRQVNLYFYSDESHFKAPEKYALQSWTGTDWANIRNVSKSPPAPLADGENIAKFPPVKTSKLRLFITSSTTAATALVELKAYYRTENNIQVETQNHSGSRSPRISRYWVRNS